MTTKSNPFALPGDIQNFSRLIYHVLSVAVALYPLLAIVHILSELWRIFSWPADHIAFGGWYLYSLLSIPSFGISLFGGSRYTPASTPLHIIMVIVLLLLASGVLMWAILYFRRLFKALKDGASPFQGHMVALVLTFAKVITIVSILRFNLHHILPVVLVWLLYYIFEHGRKLQEESDTTL